PPRRRQPTHRERPGRQHAWLSWGNPPPHLRRKLQLALPLPRRGRATFPRAVRRHRPRRLPLGLRLLHRGAVFHTPAAWQVPEPFPASLDASARRRESPLNALFSDTWRSSYTGREASGDVT